MTRAETGNYCIFLALAKINKRMSFMTICVNRWKYKRSCILAQTIIMTLINKFNGKKNLNLDGTIAFIQSNSNPGLF